MEFAFIVVLIVLNGIFAMSEMAIVSSRKSLLQKQAAEGNKKAQKALELSKSPNKFLSTIQIGITFIGIFAGAYGGDRLSSDLALQFSHWPLIGQYSQPLSFFLIVSVITFLSLVIGELVPKRIAMSHAETIAMYLAGPMSKLSNLTSPLVNILSFSTETILKLSGQSSAKTPKISEEELSILVREGAESGVLQTAENDILERTFKLNDKKVQSIMTSRQEIVWLDIDTPFSSQKDKLAQHPHANYPVCQQTIDNTVGIIRSEDILTQFIEDQTTDHKKDLHKPLFVPENMDCLKVLELFKKSGIHIALVIDEYGNIQGLISITDVLEAIVGDIPTVDEIIEKEIIKRENGTFLIDGLIPIDEFKEYFHLKRLPNQEAGTFNTLGGFIMHQLQKIPASGESITIDNFKLEIVDMDGNRIDKILLTHHPKQENQV